MRFYSMFGDPHRGCLVFVNETRQDIQFDCRFIIFSILINSISTFEKNNVHIQTWQSWDRNFHRGGQPCGLLELEWAIYITLAQRKCIIFLSYYQPHHERDIHSIVYISISLYFEMTSILIPFWEGVRTVLIVLYISLLLYYNGAY